jgi:hypothetical protein
MILKKIHVKNFRSIRDVAVDVQDQLAIVGGNGSGKSSILRALERFFGQSTSVELDDFFARKTDEPIEIGLTFTGFTEAERESFASRSNNNEMSVVRVFEAGAGRNNGRYYGATLQHPPFFAVRSAENATNARTAYNQLRGSEEIYRCAKCQTALWSDYGRRKVMLFVRIATLKDARRFSPDVHIFTRSKLPCDQLALIGERRHHEEARRSLLRLLRHEKRMARRKPQASRSMSGEDEVIFLPRLRGR